MLIYTESLLTCCVTEQVIKWEMILMDCRNGNTLLGPVLAMKFIRNKEHATLPMQVSISNMLLRSFTARSFGSSLYVLQRLHLFDLFYEICFLVIELFVIGPVRMELGQKLNQLLAIPQEYLLDCTRLVRVSNKHLHSHTEHLQNVSQISYKAVRTSTKYPKVIGKGPHCQNDVEENAHSGGEL